MKKAISLLLIVVILNSLCLSAGAAESEMDIFFEHKIDFPSTDAAGTNGWLYQYNPGETFADYIDLDWDGSRTSYVRKDGNGNVDNYANKWTLHPGGPGPTALVWVAPTAGRVRLTVNGGVCKSSSGGSDTFATIIHTDKNSVGEKKLWYKHILGTDTLGTDNVYNIEADVKIGDKIYFEVSCDSTAGAATVWNPQVTYLKTVMFSNNDNRLTGMAGLSGGETVTATFYQEEAMTRSEKSYIVVYDEHGRVRTISEPRNFLLGSSYKFHETTVTMPILDADKTFEGWKISFVTLTTENGRYFPTVDLEKLSLE